MSEIEKPSEEKKPFPELETKCFSNAIIFELIPNGKFTEEQTERIKNISHRVYNYEEDDSPLEKTLYLDCLLFKHLVLTYGRDKDAELFLCLANGKEWSHEEMLSNILDEFGSGLVVRDAGHYLITEDEGKHYIGSYVSEGLWESGRIIPDGCFAYRKEITDMNIGIEGLQYTQDRFVSEIEKDLDLE